MLFTKKIRNGLESLEMMDIRILWKSLGSSV